MVIPHDPAHAFLPELAKKLPVDPLFYGFNGGRCLQKYGSCDAEAVLPLAERKGL